MKIYIDGQLLEESEAKISVFDHGLLYGDGVFEGIRFYSGRVFRLDQHIQRLFDSARAIHLAIPMTFEELIQATLDTIRANNLVDGYIRLVVTRGVGNLGLNPYQCPKASVIIIAATIALYPEECYTQGLKLVTCATRRLPPAVFPPQVKSLNYLNNIMAKIEAIQAGAQEGLMLNEQGYVAECTGDNLFVVKQGGILTPPVTAGALDGITRRVIFEIGTALGIAVREAILTRYEVYTADECFLTGSAAEVVPVVELDKRPIAEGRPGPVTQRVIARFKELVSTTGTPV